MAENRVTLTINGVTKEAPQRKEIIRADGMVPYKHISDFQFALSEQIGFGFSSRVYRGRNSKTNEQVAIKVIQLTKADSLEQELMANEVSLLEALRQTNCSHTLRLFEVVRSKNNLYIVTEYCEGKDISKIMKEKKQLSELQAQSIMRMLLKAYAQVHRLGFIHRDLKPGNMLMKKGVLKLADFGFAIKASECNNSLTYNVGSQYYMPPQTIQRNAYSTKSDIWALGVIAYELVHGRLPWKHRNQSVLLDTIMQADLQTIIDQSLFLSPSYQTFIKMCLQINCSSRASIEEVLRHPWPLAQQTVLLGIKEKPPQRAMMVLQRKASLTQPLEPLEPETIQNIQTAIMGQINHCKFLEELCQFVGGSTLNKKNELRNQFLLKIMLKLEMLQLQGYQNVFNLEGFADYAKRERWVKLAQLIDGYDQAVKAKFRNQIVRRTNDTNDLVINALRALKENIRDNFYLIEELTFYLQLKQMESKMDILNFAKLSHVQILAKKRCDTPPSEELIQRLRSKIQLMGL